jgi:predicted alpha/beta hydrolase family esterase
VLRDPRPAAALLACCLGGLCLTACYGSPGLEPAAGRELASARIALRSETVELHLARPAGALVHRPLLLYATGDGGWRPADRQVFGALLGWGYAVAGFDARDYLAHFEAVPGLVTPEHVGDDYLRIARLGREQLRLAPDTPLVLVGFSRGAGLAVVAATHPALREQLAGVVAIALGDVEENVHRLPSHARQAPEVLEPFLELPGIGVTPVAVIQSTRDRYLPAAAARRLFGPDSKSRRLVAVDARGHTFGGARERLLQRIRESLAWIELEH